MKKLLLVLCAVCVTTVSVNAAEQPKQKCFDKQAVIQRDAQKDIRMHRDAAFEKRLKLTEVQKLKAREIRQNGHDKLKPIVDKIREKKQEAEMVRRSKIAVQVQEEKLTAIDEDLKVLEKQAQEIRKANMKEFESILTREQKKILKNMKKEGRKNFHRAHPCPVHPMQPLQAK